MKEATMAGRPRNHVFAVGMDALFAALNALRRQVDEGMFRLTIGEFQPPQGDVVYYVKVSVRIGEPSTVYRIEGVARSQLRSILTTIWAALQVAPVLPLSDQVEQHVFDRIRRREEAVLMYQGGTLRTVSGV